MAGTSAVEGVRYNVGRAVVYTLTVGTDHTFFVGAARVLVHNAWCPTFSDAAAQRIATRITNAINDHLTPSDLEGAWRDVHGDPVPKPGGGFYNHHGEVQDALASLRSSIGEFRKLLDGPTLSEGDRAAVQVLLSNSSKTLDYVEKVVYRDTWIPGTQVP